ncbi:hypothetical protein KGQ34_03660 [Patescibacteria group bacterium]|nr:hypothetical protein [Patescibacteria group bacterium]
MIAVKNFFSSHETAIRIIFLILIFFLFAYRPVNDPDFGWHLAAGNIEIASGAIPKLDLFSWTMPEYQWVNHEYLADAFYFALYRLGHGTLILLLLYVAVGFLIFVVLLPRLCGNPDWEDRMLIALSALFVSRPFFGVRTQVLGWLGFLLVWFLWERYLATREKKWLWFLLPLFLLWANVHASFPIGFVLLGLLMFFDVADSFPGASQASYASLRLWFAREKEKICFFALIGVASLAATFINPFGYHLHLDLIRTIQSPLMKSFIAEWVPAAINAKNAAVFYAYLFSFFLIIFHKIGIDKKENFSFRDTVLFLLFLGAALSSQRLIPFFVLVSLPMLYKKISSNKLMVPALAFVLAGAMIFPNIALNRNKTEIKNPDDVIYETPRGTIDLPQWGNQKYFSADVPAEAFGYTKTHLLPDRVFNDYNWGGAMIWELPNVKTFIDGRMPYWEMNGKNIFRDYIIIESARPGWHEKIQEYGINWFLVRPNSAIAAALLLEPQEWEKRFEDAGSIIFVKNGM